MKPGVRRREDGYVLILAVMVVTAMLMLGALLLAQVQVNQQHVVRDRAYTQSLEIAEAGLNQYLWMVASGSSTDSNDFAIPGADASSPHKMTYDYYDPYSGEVLGQYTMQVTPPTADKPEVAVVVTGMSSQPVEQSRTVKAAMGRPAFSEYVLLTNDEVWIGGPLTRVWHGKTHSNTGICIDTANISDIISCARKTYTSSLFGGTHNGVWSGREYTVPTNDPSRTLWQFPVPAIDFGTVTSDLARLSSLAVGTGVNLPYSTTNVHDSTRGWYIKLLGNKKYQIRLVTGEYENRTYKSGNDVGGYLTITTSGLSAFGISSGDYNYPEDGVIFVNDNVWVEGTNVEGRITIACSGQLNPVGKTAATSIHVVGDLTYKKGPGNKHDGTVAVGLIAQNNIEIPAYAPWGKSGQVSELDMEIDAALIAQQGKEFCRAADLGGPTRDLLTIYGSVSSYSRPYRYSTGGGGFANGANVYDPFLLHNPPPYFPKTGTFQILNWQELPSTQALEP
jgi:hypothetical protein